MITKLFSFFFFSSMLAMSQVQLGDDLNGFETNAEFGKSISMSEDGSRVAISAPRTHQSSSGYVEVYEYDGNSWNILGNRINGETYFGGSISINASGDILVASTREKDLTAPPWRDSVVEVFRYTSGSWERIGDMIRLESLALAQDRIPVSINAEGNTIAVGITAFQEVRVFENINDNWVQKGESLFGTANHPEFSEDVEISANGNRIAVGDSDYDSYRGYVQVFEFQNGSWQQVGQNIVNPNQGVTGKCGFPVDINSDGTIIAMQCPRGAGGSNGVNIVFEEQNGVWAQMGGNILNSPGPTGTVNGISLNNNGKVIAIGNTYWKGFVTVFQYLEQEWVQVNDQITGNGFGDDMGRGVAISGSGEIVAAGAPGMTTPNGTNSGLARMYSFDIDPTILSTPLVPNKTLLIYPNPSSGPFNLKFTQEGAFEINIYDFSGRKVYFKKLLGNESEHLLSIPTLNNGIYILELTTGSSSLSQKIVVHK